jgi:hypothetical protein
MGLPSHCGLITHASALGGVVETPHASFEVHTDASQFCPL